MSKAQPAPDKQELPEAPSTSALNNLQAMVNMVLIQSGMFLKEHQTAGAPARRQFTLKRTIPLATERFHDSLDELENEIHQAQAVLRRDLALLKADRKKREQAAREQEEAAKARLAAESSAKKNVPEKKEEPPAKAEVAPTKPETSTTNEQPSKLDAEPTALKREAEDVAAPMSIDTNSATARDPLFDGTPTTGNPQDTEFDFDAIFGDSVMDVSGNDANTQGDIDMDAPALDLDQILDDSGPSGLLSGLEDFAAKSSDDDAGGQPNATLDIDFAMADVPEANTNANANNTTSAQPTTTKPEEAPTAQETTNNADDANMLDTMTTDNLDDLFNMDYQDPEDTQFDDAFFGFGEN